MRCPDLMFYYQNNSVYVLETGSFESNLKNTAEIIYIYCVS